MNPGHTAIGESMSRGWVGEHGVREIEPAYQPDIAGEIDRDTQEPESDFTVAAEIMREILEFTFSYRGDTTKPNLQSVFRRYVAVAWTLRPDLLAGASLSELSVELACTRALLSKIARTFGDRWGGLRNRLMKTEGARRVYSEAQLKDHWRHRKAKTPVASDETTGAHAEQHSKSETVHSEASHE
jgi:hypothetical protein